MHEHGRARSNEAENGRTPHARRTGPRPTALPGLLALQSSAGNAAVVQMLRQGGHPWPPQEHQHHADCGHQQAERPVQRSTVHDVLRAPGQPMDGATRSDMEARLGADFSDVRIHNDPAAKASAAEVGARAYTSGNHIVIGDSGGDPHTLAHELTHVIQQRQGPVAGTDTGDGLKVSDPSDRFEREAEANAVRAMSAAPVPGRQEATALQRFSGDNAISRQQDDRRSRSSLTSPEKFTHVQRTAETRGSGEMLPTPLSARGGTTPTGIPFIDNHVLPERAKRIGVSNPWIANFAVLMYRDKSAPGQETKVISSFNTGNFGPHSEEALIGHLNSQRTDFEPLALFTDRIPCNDCRGRVVGPTITGRGSRGVPVPVYYITADRDQGDIKSWWE